MTLTPDNYRGITVMPCLAKFFSSVLNNIFICIPQGKTFNTFFHFTRAGSSCASLVVWFHVGMAYNVAITFWWGKRCDVMA